MENTPVSAALAARPAQPVIRALLGDARTMMTALPANSVDCCITSPPYWGLRDYGLEPVAWGGSPDCTHRWIGDTCSACDAWLGSLGLEPTVDLFVAHIGTTVSMRSSGTPQNMRIMRVSVESGTDPVMRRGVHEMLNCVDHCSPDFVGSNETRTPPQSSPSGLLNPTRPSADVADIVHRVAVMLC